MFLKGYGLSRNADLLQILRKTFLHQTLCKLVISNTIFYNLSSVFQSTTRIFLSKLKMRIVYLEVYRWSISFRVENVFLKYLLLVLLSYTWQENACSFIVHSLFFCFIHQWTFICLYVLLRIEPSAPHMLYKPPTTEL